MSEGMWTAVIGGVAAIIAAVVAALIQRGCCWPNQDPNGKPKPEGGAATRPNPPPCGGQPKARERWKGATKFGHKRILKEMSNGAVLEEWDGKTVLHKDGVVLLWPQRDTVSGMLSEGFIQSEATGDGKNRWSLA